MAPSPPKPLRGWIYKFQESLDTTASTTAAPANPTGDNAQVPPQDPFGSVWAERAARAAKGLCGGPNAATHEGCSCIPGLGGLGAANADPPGVSAGLSAAELRSNIENEEAGPSHAANDASEAVDDGDDNQVAPQDNPDGEDNDLVLQPDEDGAPSENLGDLSITASMSADIPPEKSTSFYVRGLGADTTFSDILAAIRGVGRIYHLQVSPPTGVHPGCTAMICFFTRAAAEKFRNQTLAGFRVKGYNAKVVWNWILVSEQMKWKNASRVLIIRGPDSMVNVTVISEFINKLIPKYDMENIYLKPHESIQGFSELQLHFGGFRGQAGRAMVALKRKFRGSGVRITYGDDPCE